MNSQRVFVWLAAIPVLISCAQQGDSEKQRMGLVPGPTGKLYSANCMRDAGSAGEAGSCVVTSQGMKGKMVNHSSGDRGARLGFFDDLFGWGDSSYYIQFEYFVFDPFDYQPERFCDYYGGWMAFSRCNSFFYPERRPRRRPRQRQRFCEIAQTQGIWWDDNYNYDPSCFHRPNDWWYGGNYTRVWEKETFSGGSWSGNHIVHYLQTDGSVRRDVCTGFDCNSYSVDPQTAFEADVPGVRTLVEAVQAAPAIPANTVNCLAMPTEGKEYRTYPANGPMRLISKTGSPCATTQKSLTVPQVDTLIGRIDAKVPN